MMWRFALAFGVIAFGPSNTAATCPVLQSTPYRDEPSPFGWPVSPFNFDYRNPSNWPNSYAACGGLRQSPIDIAVSSDMCPMQMDGADGSLATAAIYTPLQGGTIVNVSAYMRTAYVQGMFGTLTMNGITYTAKQLHVTTPALHTLDGASFDAELMIVHVPVGQNNALHGSAIVSVLYSAGDPSDLLTSMGFTDDDVPMSTDSGGSWAATVDLDIPTELAGPVGGPTYFYNGSVPVPPCTENVKWFVTGTPMMASGNQLQKLASMLSCFAGGTAKRPAAPNPPVLNALNGDPGIVANGVCRNIVKDTYNVGGPHDQATCQAFLRTGSPSFNRTAACWDTAQPKNYYDKCLASPIDIKPSQAHIESTELPASSFMFYRPVAEVQVSPSTFALDFTPVNRSQLDNYGDFGYLMLNGRRYNARKLSMKAISSHTWNGVNFAGELNIEHTLFGDDLHDLYNMSLVSGAAGPGLAGLLGQRRTQSLSDLISGQTTENLPVNGDVLHRVIVSIPLTIGAASSLLVTLGAGTPQYTSAVASGGGYSVQASVDINAGLRNSLAGGFEWYSGGLTTPGCSNFGVRWLLFNTPLQVSIDQLNILSLGVSGMDSTRVNQTVIAPQNYANHVWRNSLPPFANDMIRGAEQLCNPYTDWNYANVSCWGVLYPVCTNGRSQSPININTTAITEFGQDNFLSRTGWHPLSGLRVANTGRSISFFNEQMGYVKLLGKSAQVPHYFTLTQVNLHMPSEHLIDGRQFAAELSVIHKEQVSVLETGSDMLITSFMFNVGTVRNPLLDQLLGQVPTMPGQWTQVQTPIDLLRSLGPALDGNFYRYSGSITAPSCAETVKWLVFEKALNMSQDQWVSFKAMFPNPSNNRPVQPLYGRTVAKNSFREGSLRNVDFFLSRTDGVSRAAPGPAFIIAPIVGSVLLAVAVMGAVFVREDRRRKLEAAGGLVLVENRF